MEPLPAGWREIANRVNDEVNALESIPDQPGRDVWERAGEKGGDCEDMALEKLHRLMTEGFPIERLRLATCRVGWEDQQYQMPHAVLVISAPDDHYVLDNRFPRVVPVYALIVGGYSLEAIQKAGGSLEWIEWKHT